MGREGESRMRKQGRDSESKGERSQTVGEVREGQSEKIWREQNEKREGETG